jgi:hypothetical protein
MEDQVTIDRSRVTANERLMSNTVGQHLETNYLFYNNVKNFHSDFLILFLEKSCLGGLSLSPYRLKYRSLCEQR